MAFALPVKKYRTFVIDVTTMMSGKTVAAAIALVTMPIVARLFEPSHFGVAATFLSITGIVSQISSLRYERALVLPKSDDDAVVLMALTYRILLGVCALMLVLIAIYEAMPVDWAIFELLGVWRWLLPLGVLLLGGLQIQEAWIARQGGFKLVAATTVLGTILTAGVRIGSGLTWGTSVLALISSNLLGAFGRIVCQRAASIEGLKAAFGHFSYESLRRRAIGFSDFPRLDAPAGLIFALGQNLPVLFFGAVFSPSVAGLYAMANRLSQAPITIVANSTRRVFLQKTARINNQGRSLLKAFLLTTGGLLGLGLVPFTLIWLFGQPLLGWLLGDAWLEAGRYLEIMAPWLLMIWVTAPSNPVFVVLRKQKTWLSLQTGLTVLRLGAFGWAYLIGAGPEGALQAFVIATVCGNLVTILMALKLIVGSKAGPRDSASNEVQDVSSFP